MTSIKELIEEFEQLKETKLYKESFKAIDDCIFLANNKLNKEKQEIEDLLFALKDTHNLYIQALKNGNHFTHDTTRLMSNEGIFQKYNLESNVKINK